MLRSHTQYYLHGILPFPRREATTLFSFFYRRVYKVTHQSQRGGEKKRKWTQRGLGKNACNKSPTKAEFLKVQTKKEKKTKVHYFKKKERERETSRFL
jgi:hypothetical protein